MIRLIIFDWDDVFTLGSKEGYFSCYRRVLDVLGVKLDPKEEKRRILSRWGQPCREELKELLKENPSLLDRACHLYRQHKEKYYVGNLKLVNGVIELLNNLKDSYILTIATGAEPKILKAKVFPKFNIPDVFSQIVSSHDIKDPAKSKPDPLMVEMILKKQGIKPQNAVLVGDAGNDVLMARKAGVTPIVVLTGHLTRKEAQELGVDYIIKDVSKLESVLKTLEIENDEALS